MRRRNIHLAQAVLHRTASAVAHDTARGPDISRGRHAARDLHVLHRARQVAEQTSVARRNNHAQAGDGVVVAVERSCKIVALADRYPVHACKVNIAFQRQRPVLKVLVYAEHSIDQQRKADQFIRILEGVTFLRFMAFVPTNVRLDQRISVARHDF